MIAPQSTRRASRIAMLALVTALLTGLSSAGAHATDARPSTNDANGTWSTIRLAPNPQDSQASFYDASRSRLIIFGGWVSKFSLNTLWELSFSGTPRWSLIPATGGPPPARYGATFVYDSVRDRLLLFGGSSDGNAAVRFNDVWSLNLSGPPAWTLLTPAGTPPSARVGHMAIYDPIGDRMLVFGGYDGNFENDLSALSLSGTPTWSTLSPAGVPPLNRDWGTVVYDPVQSRMLLFGGNVTPGNPTPPSPANDTWALSLGGPLAWTQLATGLAPAPRLLHASFYDAARNRMITMGGTDNVSMRNDTWALSLGGIPQWAALSPAGTLPGRRSDQSFVYDPAGDRGILFGGRAPDPFYDDVWALSLAGGTAWSRLEVSPLPRLLHKSVFDESRDAYVTFGGTDAANWMGDLWSLSLGASPAWTQLGPGPNPHPPARSDHVFARDPGRDRLVVFGGRNLNIFFGDTWVFDMPTQAWTQLGPSGPAPSAREGMTGMYDALRDRLLVFGGWDGNQSLNETLELDFSPSPHWVPFTPAGPLPAPRYAHAMIYDAAHDRLVVTGGFNGSSLFDDTWALNLSGAPQWTQIPAAGVGPGMRDGEDAIYDPVRSRMVVFGGFDFGFFNDTYALDLNQPSPTWVTLQPAGTPPPVRDFSYSVYDAPKDRMVLFGGNALMRSIVFPEAAQDVWTLDFADHPTPTRVSFAGERTDPGAVHITWYTPDGAGESATAYRRQAGGDWQPLGTLVSNASGLFTLDDRVPQGGQFGYRLGVQAPTGEEFTDEYVVTVPRGLIFGFASSLPNPVTGPLAVEFRLASAEPASLELVDVRGRAVVRVDVTGLGPGAHSVDLASGRQLASGVYVVRLLQGARLAQRKIALLR